MPKSKHTRKGTVRVHSKRPYKGPHSNRHPQKTWVQNKGHQA